MPEELATGAYGQEAAGTRWLTAGDEDVPGRLDAPDDGEPVVSQGEELAAPAGAMPDAFSHPGAFSQEELAAPGEAEAGASSREELAAPGAAEAGASSREELAAPGPAVPGASGRAAPSTRPGLTPGSYGR
ncbi:MAG TPA: hypothetical protein VF933_02615, partial [Streptosporangiaceae bacterium]